VWSRLFIYGEIDVIKLRSTIFFEDTCDCGIVASTELL